MDNINNLSIKGFITVTSNKDGVLYNNPNTITNDALEIVARCLTQLNNPISIDKIKVSGTFGDFERTISNVSFDQPNNTLDFQTIFYEQDFDGDINSMELICSGISKTLATKAGLSITKDDTSRVQINWKIKIS